MTIAGKDRRAEQRFQAQLAGWDIPEAPEEGGGAWARALALRDRERAKRQG